MPTKSGSINHLAHKRNNVSNKYSESENRILAKNKKGGHKAALFHAISDVSKT